MFFFQKKNGTILFGKQLTKLQTRRHILNDRFMLYNESKINYTNWCETELGRFYFDLAIFLKAKEERECSTHMILLSILIKFKSICIMS